MQLSSDESCTKKQDFPSIFWKSICWTQIWIFSPPKCHFWCFCTLNSHIKYGKYLKNSTQIGAFLTTCSIFRYISIWYPIHFTKNDANQKNNDINLIPVLKIESRHKRIIARAPMLSRRICSSCISSQLFPEYPDWQRQVYRSAVSRLIHCPPLRHGLSKHSLRSTQLFPSGVTRWPLGQLFFFEKIVFILMLGRYVSSYRKGFLWKLKLL